MKSFAGKVKIFGKHAVMQAVVRCPQLIDSLMATNTQVVSVRSFLAEKNVSVPVHVEADTQLDVITEGAIHQGWVLVLRGFPYVELTHILDLLTGPVLVLDQVQDPHNVGACIRSAVAFGCGAVLLPEHDQVGVTGVVARASAGTVFDIPIVRITNMQQSLKKLKDAGYWVVGLAGGAESIPISGYSFESKTVIVSGSEGDGLRALTRKTCDVLVKIPMSPIVESLNVSVATAIALYECNKGVRSGIAEQ